MDKISFLVNKLLELSLGTSKSLLPPKIYMHRSDGPKQGSPGSARSTHDGPNRRPGPMTDRGVVAPLSSSHVLPPHRNRTINQICPDSRLLPKAATCVSVRGWPTKFSLRCGLCTTLLTIGCLQRLVSESRGKHIMKENCITRRDRSNHKNLSTRISLLQHCLRRLQTATSKRKVRHAINKGGGWDD